MRKSFDRALPPLCIGLLLFGDTLQAVDCSKELEARSKTELTKPFREFDQTPGSGWRPLAEEMGCELEAAELIQRYIALQTNPDRMLYWHLAQSLAFGGKPSEAAKVARQHGLRDADDVKKFGYHWNEFALAHIAFWEGKRGEFEKQVGRLRDAIQAEPHVTAIEANKRLLESLEKLDRHFSKPYVDALRSR